MRRISRAIGWNFIVLIRLVLVLSATDSLALPLQNGGYFLLAPLWQAARLPEQ